MNEPIVPGEKPATDWLAAEFFGKHYVQRIALDLAGRRQTEVAKSWVAELASAIRQVDDRHMITVGVIPWAYEFKNAKPLFYSPEAGGPLDFVSVHFYPKSNDIPAALAALQRLRGRQAARGRRVLPATLFGRRSRAIHRRFTQPRRWLDQLLLGRNA